MNQNNIETYYFRLNTDKLYSDLFMIDGGIFDIQGQFNIYRRDNHIRFFYIFHKFNHLGYLDLFMIDGGIFDIQGQFNIYRRDNHIRFFYIFHKFNHLGYLDFIVICEYIIED